MIEIFLLLTERTEHVICIYQDIAIYRDEQKRTISFSSGVHVYHLPELHTKKIAQQVPHSWQERQTCYCQKS